MLPLRLKRQSKVERRADAVQKLPSELARHAGKNIQRMKIGEPGTPEMDDNRSVPNTGPEAIRHHVTEGCFIQNAGVLAGLAGEARRGDLKFTFALLADIGSFREAKDVLGIDRLWFLLAESSACARLGSITAASMRSAPQGPERRHEVFLKSLGG